MSCAAPSGVELRPLLAACFSASLLGGHVIREVVQRQVALDLVNKQEGTSFDPQTVADRRSQQRIVHALRHAFPHVTIVGEEGELGPPSPADQVLCDLQSLDSVVFSNTRDIASDHESYTYNCLLDSKQLVLWVDPLDGTKRFAAGLYDEVSVLIGISYKQRPLAGVVHLPFTGNKGTTYWGGPGVGVFCTTHEDSSSLPTHVKLHKDTKMYPNRQLICTVSSTSCNQVDKVVQVLGPQTVLTVGATGTMVLGIVMGESDAFFRFKAATRKWDICAVEPLLTALGGILTDTRGNLYVYDHVGNAPEFDNECGLLASIEPAVHQKLLNAFAGIKLMSALDGRAMTSQWFQDRVFNGRQVVAVNLVSNSAHYSRQSAVAKLDVHFNDHGSNVTTRVFLKKAAKNELPTRTAAQWTRDIASYRTEATFYARLASLLHARGVPSIRPLAVFQSDEAGNCTTNLVAPKVPYSEGLARCSDPVNFLMLLECLGPAPPVSSTPLELQALVNYETADCLELVDTHQALKYLANLHAVTWKSQQKAGNSIEAVEQLGEACWWTLPKRGEKELAQALEIWPQMLRHWAQVFQSESTLPSTAELESLGERMVEEAAYVHTCLTMDNATAAASTLVHGDFKSANLFFESQSRDVVAFDWQWTGVGLGAMDVATLLNTSVSISVLSIGSDDSERQLLQFYYTHLHERLQALDGSIDLDRTFPFQAFERQYMLATLEYARVLISHFWKHMTPRSCAAKASHANCGLAYRSIPHVVRMVRKMHDNLQRVKTEQFGSQVSS